MPPSSSRINLLIRRGALISLWAMWVFQTRNKSCQSYIWGNMMIWWGILWTAIVCILAIMLDWEQRVMWNAFQIIIVAAISRFKPCGAHGKEAATQAKSYLLSASSEFQASENWLVTSASLFLMSENISYFLSRQPAAFQNLHSQSFSLIPAQWN